MSIKVESKYLHLYNNQDDLLQSDNHDGIQYCIEEDHIHYHDYSKDYLTFEILSDGSFGFKFNQLTLNTDYSYIEYSIDNGQTWTRKQPGSSFSSFVFSAVKGQKWLWRGIGNRTSKNPTSSSYGYECGLYFHSDVSNPATLNIYGNIMSLLYGEDFKDKDTLNEGQAFSYLFGPYGYDENLTSLYVVNAENLVLPTNLSAYCFDSLFSGCSKLIKGPNLYAKILKDDCYRSMFSYCLNLISCPKLEFDTLDGIYCCERMFEGCSNLIDTPNILKPTQLTSGCYGMMYMDCSKLIKAPTLPAKQLVSNCYQYMFSGCESLKIGPSILAETSNTSTTSTYCRSMFRDCTNLIFIRTFIKQPQQNWVSNINTKGIIMIPYNNSLPISNSGIPNNWEKIYIDQK